MTEVERGPLGWLKCIEDSWYDQSTMAALKSSEDYDSSNQMPKQFVVATIQWRRGRKEYITYNVNKVAYTSTATYLYTHWVPQLSDFVPLSKD